MTTPHIPHPGGGRDREPAPYSGPAYAQPHPAQPNMRKGRGKLIGGIIAGVLALCCAGGVIVAVANGDPDKPSSDAVAAQDDINRRAAAIPSTSTTTSAPAPTATSSSPTAAPTTTRPTKTTPPPVIITDGTYTVGEDMPPGRYKVTERAGEYCYWSISRNGDLKDNHYGPGFPSFTVRNGDEVEVDGCPDYRKIK